MFVKITQSGGRRYVQLVESYRDDQGRVKKRTVATLGRLDQLGPELDSVIAGLARVAGRPVPEAAPPLSVSFESARAVGDVWALTTLWNELGFDRLRQVFRRTRHRIDVEALVRVMVINRLCDPDSKLGVLRWLETVSLPASCPRPSNISICCARWMRWSSIGRTSTRQCRLYCARCWIRTWPSCSTT
jgi:hypothetical protein